MLEFGTPQISQYLRVTWMLSAETVLQFPDSSKVRFLEENEAETLTRKIQKRNVFARHSQENDFYLQRISKLSNQTIIEVFRPGDPQQIGDQAEVIGDLIEKLAIISSALALPKQKLQKMLGISQRQQTETDFIIGHDFQYLRSRSRTVR